MARFIPKNLLVSWNGSVLRTCRTTKPVNLGELVPGEPDVPVVSPCGALLAPIGWDLEDEGTLRRGDLTIVAAPDAPVVRGSRDRAYLLGALAVAGMLHGAVGVAACFTPVEHDKLDAERMVLVRYYLNASAERAEETTEEKSALALSLDPASRDSKEGGSGTRAKGEEGSMGSPWGSAESRRFDSGGSAVRFGVAGPARDVGAHAPRSPSIRGGEPIIVGEAAEFGMIGALHAGAAGAPVSGSGTGEGGGGRGEGLGGFGSGHGRLGGAHSTAGSKWGDAIGDSYGAGGLGLSGVGAGGGGGAGWAGRQQQDTNVGAGEWDDNANYREFGRFLTAASGPFHALDVRDRQFLVARDSTGKPIPSCEVSVVDAQGNATVLRTMASGRALFFPHADTLSGAKFTAYARCGGNSMSAPFTLADDGVVELRGKEPRGDEAFTVDVAFALDTTGSMSEEIDAVKATLRKVAQSLEGVSLRVGLVEYKDKGDEFVTRVYPMDTDAAHFAGTVSSLRASGGGDMPEAMSQGFHDALTRLDWRTNASARLLFVIGDAPPHLDVQDGPDYAEDARLAARKGVQVHGIAASGMDAIGQVVFRQISQYTGGTEMFVLRGGAGPQSTGGGDPLASCGGTQQQYRSGNLAELVIGKVTAARRAMNGDPTVIAGRGKDESAKPCGERVALR